MIKIIISLTWDGFAPRFASDGILDDAVTRSIIDSRGILAFDLNKSGYSFQPLSGKGILFHKTITIFDGFQRDGCMMASIFLPQDTMLDGRIIKDALDNLVSNYE